MADTSRLRLPLVEALQDEIPFNESLSRLDALTHPAFASRSSGDPPALPDEGEIWVVGPSPSGDWSGHGGEIALFQNGGWLFLPPAEGMAARVSDENAYFVYDGAAWSPVGGGGASAPALALLAPLTPAADQLPYYHSAAEARLTTLSATGRGLIGASDGFSARETLGLGAAQNVGFGGLGLGGASPDSTNRLAVTSPAALFSHAGQGVQVKLNKAAAAETASLLFQSNWAGRAEMGLAGSDDWSLKTSANGSSWVEALKVAAATGEISLAQDLGLAHGGTGASTAAAARTNLGAASAADLERGGSGDLAMSLETLGWGTWLPAGDPALPPGEAGPMIRWQIPGVQIMRHLPIQTMFRSSLPGANGSARLTAEQGDLIGASLRVYNGGASGSIALKITQYGGDGAVIPSSPTVAETAAAGGATLAGVVPLPSAGVVSANLHLQTTGIPNGSYVYIGGQPVIRHVSGFQTAASIRRAAEDMTIYGTMTPAVDATANLGSASRRLATVFALTGAINTSDEREKRLSPSEELEALAEALAGLPLHAYQWLSSIDQKGEWARLHVGPLAQEAEAAILAADLNPDDYALFCRDFETETAPALDPEGVPLLDSAGEPILIERRRLDDAGEPVSRLGLRMDQTLFALIHAERRRAERLEARLAALEAL